MNKIAKTSLIAAVAAGIAVPGLASAQSYDSRTGAYYDACQRDTTNRSTTGALVGAGIGAVIGSQVAANKVRTEGSVLGGLVGALIGGSVGQSSAACSSGSVSRYGQPYYGSSSSYYGYSQPSYAYGQPSYSYGSGGYPGSYNYDYSYAPSSSYGYSSSAYGYGSRVYDQRSTTTTYYYPSSPLPRGDRDGCQMVDSPVRMPDGRTQTRLVKVCLDSQGRYQIVN